MGNINTGSEWKANVIFLRNNAGPRAFHADSVFSPEPGTSLGPRPHVFSLADSQAHRLADSSSNISYLSEHPLVDITIQSEKNSQGSQKLTLAVQN